MARIASRVMPNNCPINERTGDNRLVGRCCFYLKDGVCPRHGDVSEYRQRYINTGELTDELELILFRSFKDAMQVESNQGKKELILDRPWPGVIKAVVDVRTGDTKVQLEKPLNYVKFTVKV